MDAQLSENDWVTKIDRAKRHEKTWHTDARATIRRYRRESPDTELVPNRAKFDILYANTQTLQPAMYSSTPKANVDTRFKDPDPVSQAVSEMLERALEYSIDSYDFDAQADRIILDYLLPGRGVARVRYIPTFSPTRKGLTQVETDKKTRFILEGDEIEEIKGKDVETDDQGPYVMRDEVSYEETQCEYVHWDDFRMSPARNWAEVTWISFRHLMTKEELVDQFGEIGNDVPLQKVEYRETDTLNESGLNDEDKRGEIFEVWDRKEKKVHVVARGLTKELLEQDDPLKLENFFPIPEPLYSIKTNGTMIPRPEFMIYKDQADELDDVTGRIGAMVRALKANGFYAASQKDWIAQLQNADDDEYIPVENWQALQDKGGIEGAIAYFPIEARANVLQILYAKRSELIDTIYQITGIGDIMRGMGDPRETKGAQELKAQFGSRRLYPRQQDCEVFFRDILRLKAEIIAKHFSPQTLQAMTGIQVTPQMLQLLRNDAMRCFKIEVQTDSMIAPNAAEEKQDVQEFFQALGGFMQSLAPMIQGGALAPQAAKAMILAGARRFRFTREVEQELNAPPPPPTPPQPDPSVQVATIKAKTDIQIAQMQTQASAQKQQQDHTRKAGVDAASIETERQKAALQFVVQLITAQLNAKADAQSTAADVHSALLDFAAVNIQASQPDAS